MQAQGALRSHILAHGTPYVLFAYLTNSLAGSWHGTQVLRRLCTGGTVGLHTLICIISLALARARSLSLSRRGHMA